MCKYSGIVLFMLLLLYQNKADDQLCSVQKSKNTCICKRVTDISKSSIIIEADCSRSKIQVFPQQEQLIDDLNLLDLSHNEIDGLNTRETTFYSSTVETLLLSYNRIDDISNDFFKDIPNLKKLDLSYNSLTSLPEVQLFENLQYLEYLDLSFNNIQTIGENIFAPLTHLLYLDLSYNNESLGRYLTENMSHPLTTKLALNLNITTLRLDNLGLNDLHSFYFVNYTNLKHVSLADNHFTEVPQIPSSAQYVDLSGSDIAEIQAKKLSFHKVKTLKLDRMRKLEKIHHYAFYNLFELEELSIRFCRNLEDFNELTFGALHKNMTVSLKKLYLSGNSLRSLNSTYKFLFRHLDLVDLTDNPWSCDCEILWLQDVDNLFKSENIKCSSPSRIASKKMIDIVDKDLPGCYPEKYGKKSHRIVLTVLAVCVIVLSGLVAYLIYYSPKFRSNRSLGPQSPYNSVTAD